VDLQHGALRLEIDPRSAELSVCRAGSSVPAVRAACAFLRARPQQGAAFEVALGAGGLDVEQRPLLDAHGAGLRVTLSSRQAGNGLRLGLELRLYDERPFLLLRLQASNRSRERFFLERFVLLRGAVHFSEAAQLPLGRATGFFKAGWHDWVFAGFRGARERDVRSLLKPWSGQMHFDPQLPIGWRRGEFWGSGWGVLAGGRQAVVAGLATLAEQFGLVHVHAHCRPPALELAAAADGVPLEPGQEGSSEWGYLQLLDLPHPEPLLDYAQAVAREMKPRVPAHAPLPAWTHWYQYFQDISEERFLDSVRALAAQREVLAFGTAQLDDGYQSAWGDWLECNPKFPRGLSKLAAEVRARGLVPGLWLAPFVVQPGSRLQRAHPEWLLRDGRGRPDRPVNSGYFYSFFGNALDATHPAVPEHLERLGETLRGWGFGFIKADFCYAGALPGRRYDPSLTRAQALRRGLQALRRGLGEQTFLLGCGCPYGPALGVVDAMRIGPDTAPGWRPELWSLPWTRALLRSERSLPSLRNALRHVLAHSALHRRWWWNDPDCLLARDFHTRLGTEEVRSSLSLVGLSGGLVVSSDEPARLSPQRRRWLAMLTPVLSPGGRALDLLEREMPELYDLPLSAAWGSWHVVLVANWQDRPRRKTLELERLGLPADRPLHVFDFWGRTCFRHTGPVLDLGKLAPHASRLLRLCPADLPGPCLAGSTLHITQGLEVASLRAEPVGSPPAAGPPATDGSLTRVHVELRDLGRRAEGELWLALPGGEPLPVSVSARGKALLSWELRSPSPRE
jgi:alpha-galactosidase